MRAQRQPQRRHQCVEPHGQAGEGFGLFAFLKRPHAVPMPCEVTPEAKPRVA